MSLASSALLDAVVSHAAASGHFERVNTVEPKVEPGTGLSCAVWVQSIGPSRSSGLQATSAVVIFNVRIFTSMTQQPQDMIDPNVMEAVDALMTAYSGDFQLDGLVRMVDIYGMAGTPLAALAGFVKVGQTLHRIMTLTVPLIINDVWEQVA